jgi:RNA polymerase sigma factor (sigma-70 family)
MRGVDSIAMPRSPDDYSREILRMEKFLRAYLHRFAPQSADIEDLLQETYARLFGLTPEERAAIVNVQGFAVRSARNVAMDWVRHRQVIAIDSIEEIADWPVIEDEARLEEIVHTHQQLERVARGVARLPERCRQIFTLRRVYGWSQKEIAQRLGIAEGTVEQQLVKAVRRCAEVLRERGDQKTAKRRWLDRLSSSARKPGDAG